MNCLTELCTNITDTTANTNVEVTNQVVDVEVLESTGYTAEVSPTNFVISRGAMYSGYLDGNAPQWVSDIVDSSVETRISTDYQDLINTYSGRLDSAELGVTQEILRAQNAEESLSGLITTVKAELNGNIALVEDIAISKVTATEATALVNTLVGARWLRGNETTAESYINNLAIAKVTDGFAENTVYQGLISSVNDPDTGLTAIGDAQELFFTNAGIDPVTGNISASSGYLAEYTAKVDDLKISLTEEKAVTAGMFQEWDGATTPTIGMVKFVEDVQYQYLGGILGWKRTDKAANDKADTALGWAAGASSFVTDPDTGEITGWGYADGSGVPSTFKIKAQNFQISNGVSGYNPFSIVGSNIKFDGLVEFSNVSGSPTYTEGYGVPTSTSQPVTSVYLNRSDNSTYTYTTRGWIPGGDPDAITQDTLNYALANDTTIINGSKITTGTINAQRLNVAQLSALGITAKNIQVPGVNGGAPLFSASNGLVTISNLKILGTASLPGISKTSSYSIPQQAMPRYSAGNGTPKLALSFSVSKPYSCTYWSLLLVSSVTNAINIGISADIVVTLYINGTSVAYSRTTSAWASNVTALGSMGGLTGSYAAVTVYVSSFNSLGTFSGQISAIATVES